MHSRQTIGCGDRKMSCESDDELQLIFQWWQILSDRESCSTNLRCWFLTWVIQGALTHNPWKKDSKSLKKSWSDLPTEENTNSYQVDPDKSHEWQALLRLKFRMLLYWKIKTLIKQTLTKGVWQRKDSKYLSRVEWTYQTSIITRILQQWRDL
jgi:hypothetical protein